MAWRFLRYKRPPTPSPAPVQPAFTPPAPCACPVLWISNVPRGTDLTTHGQFPCAQWNERRMLAEVMLWTEDGPRRHEA